MRSAYQKKLQDYAVFGKCKDCAHRNEGAFWCESHWVNDDCPYEKDTFVGVPLQFFITNTDRASFSGHNGGINVVCEINMEEAKKLHRMLDGYLKIHG